MNCTKYKVELECKNKDNELICRMCSLVYHIKDDIPIVLVEKAEKIDD